MALTVLPFTLDYVAYAVVAIVVSFLLGKRRNSKVPYPPGPKGLPVIGNLLDIPATRQWLTYAKWSREYNSDVIRLNLAGTNMFVVNTYEASFELFDKRSVIYSDRPRLPMLVELVNWDWPLTFLNYGPTWRSYRKLFHRHFHTGVIDQYRPQELKATHELLHRLVVAPEKFKNHIQLMAASMILNITYGIDVQDFNDPYVQTVEKAMDALTEAGVPGAFLVDTFPIFKYVPKWMPGATFRRKAAAWRGYAHETGEAPFRYVLEEMAKGTNVPSVTSRCLEDLKEGVDEWPEKAIRDVSGVLYAGGSDTTISAISTMFLAMVVYPEVLRKAQKELDDVLGDRLPDFSDRPALPYIEAIVREVLRWQPVVPTAVPHRLMEDDVYNGMFMPKGSIVLGNAWAILNDKETYGPDVEHFNPERFLKDGELNEDVRYPDTAYGFGRRICPGRNLADEQMFITFASVLAAFDVTKAVDESGNSIAPEVYYTTGVISHPKPFKCSIKPRSNKALDLINEAYAVHHP